MDLKHRVRKERQVFEKLCRIIPRLIERLLESEEAEIIGMAELVCFFVTMIELTISISKGSEGHIQCKVRRHKGS